MPDKPVISHMLKLFKNSSLYFVTDVLVKVSQFLLLPLYTRYISPEEFGNIYLLIAVGNFLTIAVSLSLHGSISRFYFNCNSTDEVKEMYTSILKFIMIFSTFIYAVLLFFGDKIFYFIKLDFFPYIFLTLISSYLTIFYNLISSLLVAKQQAKKLSLITILSSSLGTIFTLFLVLNIEDKILAYIISIFLVSFSNFVLFLFFSRKLTLKFSSVRFKKIYLNYSLSRMPIDLSSITVSFADRFMLYDMKGEKDSGIYSISYKIGQVIQLIFMAINKAYVPILFEKFSDESKLDRKQIGKDSTTIIGLYFYVTIVGILFAKETAYILGSSYEDSFFVIVLILLSYLFLGFKLIFQPPMDFNTKYVGVKSLIWVLTSLLNISLNIILIPKYSIFGAAIASFLSYFIMLVPIIYYSNKAVKIFYESKKIFLMMVLFVAFCSLTFLEISLVNILLKLFSLIALLIIYMYILKISFERVSSILKIRRI